MRTVYGYFFTEKGGGLLKERGGKGGTFPGKTSTGVEQ